MTILGMPAAEIAIDPPLVHALLREQHPDLADLPLARVGEGWDNVLFRLGPSLVVRLPRRHAAAALIEHEQRWMPELAERLPLPIPVPQRIGRPGARYPWSWTISRWFEGQVLAGAVLSDPARVAAQLGPFVAALHQPAVPDAPVNAFRRTLRERHPAFVEQLSRLNHVVDGVAARGQWESALAAPPWEGPPLWLHGDLHPANLVGRDDQLVAVLDFGDVTAGDPAIDVAIAWMLFETDQRDAFRAAIARAACLANRIDTSDEATWQRARGWALTLAVSYLANSRDNDTMARIGTMTIGRVLTGR